MSNKRRLSKITILPTLIGTLGVFYSLLSVISSVSPVASTVSATSSLDSTVSVTLENLIALRILNKTASSTITGIDIEITPTPNGVFSKESMLVEVSTRNATGYELYMTSGGKAYSPEGVAGTATAEGAYTTDLVHSDSSIDASIPTLDEGLSITEAEFRISNSNYKNTWGYSLNGLTITRTEDDDTGITNTIVENTDTSAITYTNIPAHTTNIKINETDSPTEQDLTPVTIGVNATASKPAGTYTNILEYTAVGNPLPVEYSLEFEGNTEDEVKPSSFPIENPLTETTVASHVSFTIPDVTPISRTIFEEWNTKADGTGVSYQPGDIIEIVMDDADASSTSRTLYAIWRSCDAPSTGFCDNNGHSWTGIVKQAIWNEIGLPCPVGYHVPTNTELLALIGKSTYDDGTNVDEINVATAWWAIKVTGAYWSSTLRNSTVAYSMWLSNVKNHTNVGSNNISQNYYIMCTK